MRECNDEEKKAVLLNILIYFDKLCQKYGLKYTLDCGTLLGAARHSGFIPWDDDIDVLMPLPDYYKFQKIPEVLDPEQQYVLHNAEMEKKNCERYVYPFPKLEDNTTIIDFDNVFDTGGAFIDIFPLSGYDQLQHNNKLKKKILVLGNRVLCATTKAPKGDVLRNIKYKYCRLNYKKYRQKLIYLTNKLGYENSAEVCESIWALTKYNINTTYFSKSWMSNIQKLNFEGHKINVICKYKELLKLEYGNWEKLPPKKQQTASHSYRLYKK